MWAEFDLDFDEDYIRDAASGETNAHNAGATPPRGREDGENDEGEEDEDGRYSSSVGLKRPLAAEGAENERQFKAATLATATVRNQPNRCVLVRVLQNLFCVRAWVRELPRAASPF